MQYVHMKNREDNSSGLTKTIARNWKSSYIDDINGLFQITNIIVLPML